MDNTIIYDPTRGEYYIPWLGEWRSGVSISGDNSITLQIILQYDNITGAGTLVSPTSVNGSALSTGTAVAVDLDGDADTSDDTAVLNDDGSVTLISAGLVGSAGSLSLDFDFDPVFYYDPSSDRNKVYFNQKGDEYFVKTINYGIGEYVEVEDEDGITGKLELDTPTSDDRQRGVYILRDNGDGTAMLMFSIDTPNTRHLSGDATFTHFDEMANILELISFRGIADTTDGSGGAENLLTVNSGNSAPVAGSDALEIGEGQSITISTYYLRLNDTDDDLDTLSFVEVVASTVNGGTVTENGDGTITLTSAGTDPVTFDYKITDQFDTSSGSVTANVRAAPTGCTYTPDITLEYGVTHATASIGHHGGHGTSLNLLKLMPLGGEGIDNNGDGSEDFVIPTNQASDADGDPETVSDWFDPETWGGNPGDYAIIPCVGALVHIPTGINVSYDFDSADYAAWASWAEDNGHELEPDLFIVRVDGGLTFTAADGADTKMSVDTIFSTHTGSLTIDADAATDGTVDIAITPFDIEANDAILPDYYQSAKVTSRDFVKMIHEKDGVEDTDTALATYIGGSNDSVVVYRLVEDATGAMDRDGLATSDVLQLDGAGTRFMIYDLMDRNNDRLNEAEVNAGWRPLTEWDAVDVGSEIFLADFFIDARPDLFEDVGDDLGVLGRHTWDPSQLSLGVVVGGNVDVRGQAKTEALATEIDHDLTANSLSFTGSLADVSGWAASDYIVIAGTKRGVDLETGSIAYADQLKGGDASVLDPAHYQYKSHDAVRKIDTISESGGVVTVTWSEAIDLTNHADITVQNGVSYQASIANLTRNVNISSEKAVHRDDNGVISGVADATSSALKGLLNGVGSWDANGDLLGFTHDHYVTERGHFMVMHSDGAEIHDIGLFGLGRSDKTADLDELVRVSGSTVWVDDGDGVFEPGEDQQLGTDADNILNARGRYALHLHETGVGSAIEAELSGNVVFGSVGWGFTQHNSGANLTNNIAFDVLGAGFVSETGNETGAWTGNLSIWNRGRGDNVGFGGAGTSEITYGGNLSAGQQNGDVGQNGVGFWFEGRNLDVSQNYSLSAAQTAFVFDQFGEHQIDTQREDLPEGLEALSNGGDTVRNRDMPIHTFEDNWAIASIDGLNITTSRVHNSRKYNDAFSLLDDFKALNVLGVGIHVDYAGKYIFKNVTLLRDDARAFDSGTSNIGIWLETANADNSIINVHAEGFGEFGVFEHDYNSDNARVSGLFDAVERRIIVNDNGTSEDPSDDYFELLWGGKYSEQNPIDYETPPNYLRYFLDADGNIVDLDAVAGYNAARNLFNTSISDSTYSATVGAAPVSVQEDQDGVIREGREARDQRSIIDGANGNPVNDVTTNAERGIFVDWGYNFDAVTGVFLDDSGNPLTVNEANRQSIELLNSYEVKDGLVADPDGPTVELVDDSALGGLAALWRADKAAEEIDPFAIISKGYTAETQFLTTSLPTQTGAVSLLIDPYGVSQVVDSAYLAATIERKADQWKAFADDERQTNNAFARDLGYDLSDDVYSGSILEFKKSDEFGDQYFVYGEFAPLTWHEDGYVKNNDVTTNERIVFAPDEINAVLERDGYYVMSGVTYVDASGTTRDQKFVVMETVFSSRLTGKLDTKQIVVALDENWGSGSGVNAIDWSLIEYKGVLLDTDKIVDVEGNKFIVADKYGHFRNGSLVDDVDGDGDVDRFDVAETLGGTNYFTNGVDNINLNDIVETAHQTTTVISGKGNDVVTASAGTEAFQFITGDGADTISGYANGTDLIEIDGAIIELPSGATIPSGTPEGISFSSNAAGYLVINYGSGDSVMLEGVDYAGPEIIHLDDEIEGGGFYWGGMAPIAALDDGNWVAVWSDDNDSDSNHEIRGQIFGSDGSKITEFEFDVSDGLGVGEGADVAKLEDGSFVVVFEGKVNTGDQVSDVYIRHFGADGVPSGPASIVNSDTSSSKNYVAVTGLAGGNYVITWSGQNSGDTGSNIYGQIYDSNRAAIGGEIRLNENVAGDHFEGEITAMGGGGFAATWRSEGKPGEDTEVYARVFAADDTGISSEFRVNAEITGKQDRPDIALLNNGDFVVVWRENGVDGVNIHAQIYDAAGNTKGSEFQVNELGSKGFSATVEALSDGGFIATWSNDLEGGDVYAARFDARGAKVGTDYQVNTLDSGYEVHSQVAVLTGGQIVHSWTTNTPELRYYAQILDTPGDAGSAAVIATNDWFSFTGIPLVGAPLDVLANDMGASLFIGSVTQPDQGIVAISGNTLVYDANGAFDNLRTSQSAYVTFGYEVSDDADNTDTSSVILEINGTYDGNIAPVAADDAATVSSSSTTVLDGLLDNDTDADGDELAINPALGNPTKGLVAINADGQVEFNPNGEFDTLPVEQTETVTFTYTIDDGYGGAHIATVTLTVEGQFVPPPEIPSEGIVNGYSGDDTIESGYEDIDGDRITEGGDIIEAGAGNDSINAAGGNDIIYGEDGDDVIAFSPGYDIAYGGNGNDSFTSVRNIGTSGIANGGAGDDTFNFDQEHIAVNGGDGNDTYYAHYSAQPIHGDGGNDVLTAGKGPFQLYGDNGNDTLYSVKGAGTFYGGAGDDVISGSVKTGALKFDGGTGNDLLTAGIGSDTFIFAVGDGTDLISNYEITNDQLQFAGLQFSDLTISQSSTSVVIEYGTMDMLELTNQSVENFTASEFIFA